MLIVSTSKVTALAAVYHKIPRINYSIRFSRWYITPELNNFMASLHCVTY